MLALIAYVIGKYKHYKEGIMSQQALSVSLKSNSHDAAGQKASVG